MRLLVLGGGAPGVGGVLWGGRLGTQEGLSLLPDPAVPQGRCSEGGSLCSNRFSGDSDAPSPTPGQALIPVPVAKGPVPGRCPASLQSRSSWGLTLVPGLFSQQQGELGSMGRKEAAVSPPPLTRDWGVRKE